MQAQPPLTFTSAGNTATPAIFIDGKQRYQSIEGFGASFTDSSAYLMNQKIPKTALNGVMLSVAVLVFDRAR
jgi:O-glycosyl hydrolase